MTRAELESIARAAVSLVNEYGDPNEVISDAQWDRIERFRIEWLEQCEGCT